jgi:hypothetical protein
LGKIILNGNFFQLVPARPAQGPQLNSSFPAFQLVGNMVKNGRVVVRKGWGGRRELVMTNWGKLSVKQIGIDVDRLEIVVYNRPIK